MRLEADLRSLIEFGSMRRVVSDAERRLERPGRWRIQTRYIIILFFVQGHCEVNSPVCCSKRSAILDEFDEQGAEELPL